MTKEPKVIFFIDRALSPKSVSAALRSVGARVEVHTDHFAPDAPDVEWLPVVSEWGWVVLTKDENIGRNPLEVEAIARSGARVFILASGDMTRGQMSNLFASALSRLERFTQGNSAPFIAKLYKNGRIELWQNRTSLLRRLRYRAGLLRIRGDSS